MVFDPLKLIDQFDVLEIIFCLDGLGQYGGLPFCAMHFNCYTVPIPGTYLFWHHWGS